MRDQEIRTALDRHWAASDANDFEAEHSIYREDAVLEYPQSGERIRGRRNIQITRAKQPSKKRFAVRRVSGSGDLWVTEYILTYDGKPSYTVSIMEFSGEKVARETLYFADPFEASAWRAQWVERMEPYTTKRDSGSPLRGTLPHEEAVGDEFGNGTERTCQSPRLMSA